MKVMLHSILLFHHYLRELKGDDVFKYFGNVLTRDGYCRREIIAKEAFDRKI